MKKSFALLLGILGTCLGFLTVVYYVLVLRYNWRYGKEIMPMEYFELLSTLSQGFLLAFLIIFVYILKTSKTKVLFPLLLAISTIILMPLGKDPFDGDKFGYLEVFYYFNLGLSALFCSMFFFVKYSNKTLKSVSVLAVVLHGIVIIMTLIEPRIFLLIRALSYFGFFIMLVTIYRQSNKGILDLNNL